MIYLKVEHVGLLSDCPSFSASGSVKGMKDKYYGKNALLVKCGSYIYKVSQDTYQKVKDINRF